MVDAPPLAAAPGTASGSPDARASRRQGDEADEKAHVVVAVRTRPLNGRELATAGSGERTLSYPGPQRVVLEHKGQEHSFIFDHVFGDGTTQEQIFQGLGVQCLDQAFGGYNSTIFAYGQTGSGKTHTMMSHAGPEEDWGLVPRISAGLYRRIDELTAAHSSRGFLVQCSFLEIYNEVVHDLLVPRSKQSKGGGLEIKEAKGIGIYVKDLTEVVVEDARRLSRLIRDGFEYRSTASTNMNDRSSRSHCIFTIKLHQKDTVDSTKNTISKVNLVDLAGSERAKATGAEGVRLKEGANINKSLSALGNVINSLSSMESGKKKVYVPYRDSKLTRVLQESLGGNCLCTMVATLSAAPGAAEETLSTLNYARRAKVIKTVALKNEEAAQVKQLEMEVQALRQKLDQAMSVAGPGEQRELEEKHRNQIQQLEAFISQSWEDKQQKSKQYEEDRKMAQEEAQRAVEQLIDEQRRRVELLEQHGDLLLTLRSVEALGSGLCAGWPERIAAFVKLGRKLHSQLRAMHLYRDSASTDFTTLAELCAAAGDLAAAADVAAAAALRSSCEAKLGSMGRELDALAELEQQAYQLFHVLAPEVDVALSEAISAAAAGADADGTEARLAREELEGLLRVVRRQLARHYADLCAELQAEARPLGLQGELGRLSECLAAVSGQDWLEQDGLAAELREEAEEALGLAGTPPLLATLGLASSELPDSCLHASSNVAAARSARLRQSTAHGGWFPEAGGSDEYLEISLPTSAGESGGSSSSTAVVGVSLQGRLPCTGRWRQTYELLGLALGPSDSVLVHTQDKMFVRPAVRLVYDLSLSLVHDMACLGDGEQGWRIPPELLVYEDMTRDQKVRYFQELVDRTNSAWAETRSLEVHEAGTGLVETFTGLVKLAPADILGGKNCEETNRLLQLLAYFAIARATGSSASSMITPQWVTSWKLECFVEGDGWQWWGAPKGGTAEQAELLEGNNDATSIDLVCLSAPVRASKLRVRPVSWHGPQPGLRCEVHVAVAAEGDLSAWSEGADDLQYEVSISLRPRLDLALRALSELQRALEERRRAQLLSEGALKEQARQELGALEQQLQGSLDRIQELEARAAVAEASLLGARAENERLGEVAQGLEAELEAVSDSRDSAGEKLAELARQSEEWRREVDELTEQLAVVSDERDAARSQHEELFNRVAATDEDLVKAHTSYVDLTQRLQEQELRCQSTDMLMEEWQTTSSEVERLSQENQELIAARARLQSEVDRLRAEHPERATQGDLEARAAQLEAEVADLRAQRDNLKLERQSDAAKRDKLEAKRKDLKNRLAQSEQARKTALDRCEELFQKLARGEAPLAPSAQWGAAGSVLDVPASDVGLRAASGAGEDGAPPVGSPATESRPSSASPSRPPSSRQA